MSSEPRPPIGDQEVEGTLKRSRPQADSRFRASLIERLAPDRRRAKRTWKPVLAGVAAVVATTAAFLIAALVGAGPLAPDGPDRVTADDDCRYVTVTRRARVPVTVRTPEGGERIELRYRAVERRVKRCP